MGAQSFILTAEASNVRDAFEQLVETAKYERGHDAYNGSISTCSLGRCVREFNAYNKKNETEAREIIRKKDNGEKWVAQYIDLGVVYYVETTVKKTVKTYDAKYKQKFVIIDNDTGLPMKKTSSYDTKTVADNKALEFALSGYDVSVKKTMVKLSGNDVVSVFETQTKQVKKPKKASKTSVTKPIHKYIFFGWAAS